MISDADKLVDKTVKEHDQCEKCKFNGQICRIMKIGICMSFERIKNASFKSKSKSPRENCK